MANNDLLAPITDEELNAAQAQDDLLAPISDSEFLAVNQAIPEAPDASREEALVKSLANAASFGFGPEITVKARRLLGQGREDMTEEQEIAEEEQRQARLREQFPIESGVGELGGAITGGGLVSAGLRGGAKLAVPRLVQAGEAAIAAGAAEGATVGQRLGGLAARTAGTAAEGAAIGGVAGIAQDDVMGELETGAAIGAAFPLAGAVLRGTGRLTKSSLSKGYKALTGVDDKVITDFLEVADEARQIKDLGVLRRELTKKAQDAAESLTKQSAREGLEAASKLNSAIAMIRHEAAELSDEALDLAAKSDFRIKKSRVEGIIEGVKRSIPKIGGKPVGVGEELAEKELDSLLSRVHSFHVTRKGANLTGPDLKQLIKSTNRTIDFNKSAAGGFDSSMTNLKLKEVTARLNNELRKSIPGYKDLMQQSSNLVQFADDAHSRLGTVEKAAGALDRLSLPDKAKNQVERKILDRVSQRANVDLEKIRRSQIEAREVKAFLNEGGEKKIQTYLSRGNEELKKGFGIIARQLDDPSFERQLEVARRASQLDKQFMAGSRNVNLWAIMGHLAGRASAGGAAGTVLFGPAGAALGGIFGAMMDLYGPQATKAFLLQYSKLRGYPTINKILKMQLPEGMKKRLIDDLRRVATVEWTSEDPVPIDPNFRFQAVKDVRSTDGLSPLEKAKAITMINKDSEIPGDTLQKIVLSNGKYRPTMPEKPEARKPSTPPSVRNIADSIKTKRPREF